MTNTYEKARAKTSARIGTIQKHDCFRHYSPWRHIQETALEIEIRRAESEYGKAQVPASSYRGRVRL